MAKDLEERSEDSPELRSLKRMCDDLCRALPINKLLPSLVTHSVIDFNEMSDIQAKSTEFEQTQLLLGKIHRDLSVGDTRRFDNFVHALKKDHSCSFLLSKLEGWIKKCKEYDQMSSSSSSLASPDHETAPSTSEF